MYHHLCIIHLTFPIHSSLYHPRATGTHTMGNTPSNQHGAPKPRDGQGQPQNQQNNAAQPASSASSSRNPNLRLPMPSRNPNNLSPSESNPASPSGRSSSPRRRKSLELPDLNKLSFTPAAPVPTTATHTSHHLAPSTTANRPGDGRQTGSSQASSSAAPAQPRRWQQVLGGHGPLSKPLGAMSQLDSGGSGSSSRTLPMNMPKGAQGSSVPQTSPYSPASPQTPGKATPRDIAPKESPSRRTAQAPSVAPPEYGAVIGSESDDGAVNVPITWTGGGKTVMIAGNFSDNWRGRIPMTKGSVNPYLLIKWWKPKLICQDRGVPYHFTSQTRTVPTQVHCGR